MVKELVRLYEEEWTTATGEMDMNMISAAMFLLVTCFGGMRGVKAVWTDIAGLRFDLHYMEDNEDYTGVGWPVIGRFKVEGGGMGCHVIPIAGMAKSGVNVFEWVHHFVNQLEDLGVTKGWAFRPPDGTRAQVQDYLDDIFRKLEDIQHRTTLIEDDIDIWESYGVQQSGRRFFDTKC